MPARRAMGLDRDRLLLVPARRRPEWLCRHESGAALRTTLEPAWPYRLGCAAFRFHRLQLLTALVELQQLRVLQDVALSLQPRRKLGPPLHLRSARQFLMLRVL